MTPAQVAMVKPIHTLTIEELQQAKLYCTRFDARVKEQHQQLTMFENRLRVINTEIARRANV